MFHHDLAKAAHFLNQGSGSFRLGRKMGKNPLALFVVDKHGHQIGCAKDGLHIGADLLGVHEKKRGFQVAGKDCGNEAPLVVCLVQQGLPLNLAEEHNQAGAAKNQDPQKGKDQLQAIAPG
ncbi:MAG: hypothetical protein ACD_74C00141G0002 [uncultured bacterium]|nr:MAG: hypothetical protein ACD_74C00141G0002 [uncultured bacterium]